MEIVNKAEDGSVFLMNSGLQVSAKTDIRNFLADVGKELRRVRCGPCSDRLYSLEMSARTNET